MKRRGRTIGYAIIAAWMFLPLIPGPLGSDLAILRILFLSVSKPRPEESFSDTR